MSDKRPQERATKGRARKSSPLTPYIVGTVVVLAVVAGLILIGVAARGGNGGGTVGGPVVVPTARPASVAQNGRVFGDPAASVTVAEYLDFQCPICRRAGLQVLPAIETQFIETGVAKLEIRPIAILGDESVQAAAAAECANEQGEFWAYYDILYANQGAERSGAFSDARLKQFAEALGLDTGAFNACLDSGKYVDQVEQDTNDARAAGVKGTPTILVNGAKVETSVDAIAAAIQQAAGG